MIGKCVCGGGEGNGHSLAISFAVGQLKLFHVDSQVLVGDRLSLVH